MPPNNGMIAELLMVSPTPRFNLAIYNTYNLYPLIILKNWEMDKLLLQVTERER